MPADDRAQAEAEAKAAEHLLALKSHPGWEILMEMLRLDRLEALAELMEVDPHDWKKIQGLQNRATQLQYLRHVIDHKIHEFFETEAQRIEGADDGGALEDAGGEPGPETE